MKSILIGLVLAILIAVIAYFAYIPKVKQAAYDSGYEAGTEKGISTGTAAGVAKGISEAEAQQKREADSLAVIKKNQDSIKAVHPHKKIKQIQNWHVVDGKIAEPMPD